MIEVRDLVKVFDTRGHVVRAVDHVTTQVAKGEVLVVIGPSGSGKGTISRIVAQRLGWHYLDSGALYRAVGVAAGWASAAGSDVAAGVSAGASSSEMIRRIDARISSMVGSWAD